MNYKKIIIALLALVVLVCADVVQAAPIDSLRTSVSGARVRIVLDSKEPISYKADKDRLQLVVALPESSAKRQQAQVNDAVIKGISLQPAGKNASKLVIDLAKDCQYKVFQLKAPNRLVVDIYRINIIRQTRQLAQGVSYTFIQDELNGRQVQAYLVTVAPGSRFELRPFSAAGLYNGRGSLAKQAQLQGMPVAINASYFDTDGWVIGNVKEQGNYMAADGQARSGYAAGNGWQQIVTDIAYSGSVKLPDGGLLAIKGMNRARIANDLVLYNSCYAPSTKTNSWGREVKLKNGRVVAVSTAGNMSVEPGTVVLSGHGSNATALACLKLGDHVALQQSLGNSVADTAGIVVSGGPLLVERGRVNVRTAAEGIANDIAWGRAPRTALGLKNDGSLLLLVVDGRSSESAGMTLTELAQYLLKLGAVDAVNFDGGGSSEMVINGQLVNKPSDGRERWVSVGLGLTAKSEMLVK